MTPARVGWLGAAAFLVCVYAVPPLMSQVQTCGQGVVLRADGALVVDAWTTFTFPTTAPPGAPTPGPPQTLSGVKQTAQPTRVILGVSLPSELLVCAETAAGSKCVALSAVRRYVGQ